MPDAYEIYSNVQYTFTSNSDGEFHAHPMYYYGGLWHTEKQLPRPRPEIKTVVISNGVLTEEAG